MTSGSAGTRRALVLGGGGVTGVAWELGILAGLAEGGVDLSRADLIVGTSAGSVVAAQIGSGTELTSLYDAQLRGPGSEVAARLRPAAIARLAVAALGARDERAALARIGRVALAATTLPEAERRAIIASRLPSHEWPAERILITAVAADTGDFVVFDREAGVGYVDAVAASCAVPCVWPPVTIAGRRYIDGGMRSPANVDVAAGYDRVVVVAPLTSSFRRGASVAAQLASLPGRVASVAVSPDRAARAAIGRNVLDPARRAPAARAGRRQGAEVVARVAAVWSA